MKLFFSFRNARALLVLLGAFTSCDIPTARCQESDFGTPEAVVTADNDVTLDQMRSVALQMARNRWGSPRSGAEIPACDRDGNLTAYLFVFRLDSKPFGTDASIRSRVRESLRSARNRPAFSRPPDLDPAKAHKSEKWVSGTPSSGVSPAGNPSGGVVEAGWSREEHPWNEPWLGKGEYGTVVVSAKKSRVPVPRVIHGLPSFYTNLEPAAEKFQDRLGRGMRIKKLIYLSPGEEYFELAGSGGTARVHAHNLREDKGPPKKKASSPKLTREQKERNERLIASQWEKYGIR
jgi:hypothetical protein